MLILIGLVLIAAGVAGFFYMQHTKRELHAMIGTDTMTIPQLEDRRRISDDLGALGHSDAERQPVGGGRPAGGFRTIAEVVGNTHPRPEGPLVAEVTKSECVWYRYRIDRQYEHVEYRDGKRHRSKRTEKVVEHTSSEGYALIDEQGRTIGVDPNGTNPDGVEQSMNRYEPHHGRPGRAVRKFGIRLPAPLGGGRDSTLGYEYKEWLIRPGRRLYILGEVHDKIGPLVIGRPEQGGHFLISTRTEDELRSDRVQRHKLLAVGVIVAVIAGFGVLIGGLVS